MGPNGITAAALLLLLIIFLPAALAACRHHNNQLAIIVLNIIAVIGITAALVLSQWRNYPTIDQLLIVALAGHAVALVWACTKDVRPSAHAAGAVAVQAALV